MEMDLFDWNIVNFGFCFSKSGEQGGCLLDNYRREIRFIEQVKDISKVSEFLPGWGVYLNLFAADPGTDLIF